MSIRDITDYETIITEYAGVLISSVIPWTEDPNPPTPTNIPLYDILNAGSDGYDKFIYFSSNEGVRFGTDSGLTSQGNYSVALGFEAGKTSQGTNAVAIGNVAGEQSMKTESIAIGYTANNLGFGTDSISIGTNAGQGYIGDYSIAIGYDASISAGIGTTKSISIGNLSGSSQGAECIAIGKSAGQTSQANGAIAIGLNAGLTSQNVNSVCIGNSACSTNCSTEVVCVGYNSGGNLGTTSVVIGTDNINNKTTVNPITCIGSHIIRNQAGSIAPENTILGLNAVYGGFSSGSDVIVGYNTCYGNTATMSAGTGCFLGSNVFYQRANTGTNDVVIGKNACYGNTASAGTNSVIIGDSACYERSGNNTVAIGKNALYGTNAVGIQNVAIGTDAVYSGNIGASSVIIGNSALKNGTKTSTSESVVCIGKNTAFTKGTNIGIDSFCICIGENAGYNNSSVDIGQGQILIGKNAGYDPVASPSGSIVAIGNSAGYGQLDGGNIILNSSGLPLDSTGTDRFFIKNIRQDDNALFGYLKYDDSTKEITWFSS